jgi:hypothetical protein
VTPALPSHLDSVVVENLCIGGAHLSLRVVREGTSILMEIMDNPDELDIVVHPAMRNHRRRVEGMPATSG